MDGPKDVQVLTLSPKLNIDESFTPVGDIGQVHITRGHGRGIMDLPHHRRYMRTNVEVEMPMGT